jgi:hypothetical protein
MRRPDDRARHARGRAQAQVPRLRHNVLHGGDGAGSRSRSRAGYPGSWGIDDVRPLRGAEGLGGRASEEVGHREPREVAGDQAEVEDERGDARRVITNTMP